MDLYSIIQFTTKKLKTIPVSNAVPNKRVLISMNSLKLNILYVCKSNNSVQC